MAFSIKRLDVKAEIYDFLREDRLYAAYAIGDLEPALFRHCEWYASSRNGKLTALCLRFRGLRPDRVFLMGQAGDLTHVVDGVLKSPKAYFACTPEQLEVVRRFYSLRKTEAMLRMVLRPGDFAPVDGSVRRLAGRHVDRLQELYRWYGDVAFAPYQLERGVFYGVEREGRLVATAGTHLLSRNYRMGIVGNVFTHPDYRGLGYAAVCTSAVVEELLSQSLDVVLNVGEANEPARRVYDRLGFRVHCSFVEAFGVRRGRGLKGGQDYSPS
jgi:GNAT superfamily N-acetyltransferase